MKIITVLARGKDGCLACLNIQTDAEWLALDVRDVNKMKDFHPYEVFEINISNDKTVNHLRQGCKVDFAYIMS